MQAQRTAPSDMLCKDKFLIQCTVVPFGTSEEEIPSSMVKIAVHHLNLLFYSFSFSFCFFFFASLTKIMENISRSAN